MNLSNLSPIKRNRLIEYFKCKKDPHYFIENYIKLALAGGDRSVKLYDKQKEFVNKVYKDHHVITLKTRQTGLSTITQMLVAHIMTFHKNVVVGVIAKSGAESTDFCRKCLGMFDSMPEWMRPKFVKRTEQSFILDNGSKFYASQVNEANPEGTLRGFSINLFIIDEAAFISKIDEAYTSCAPTLFKAQQLASQAGIPYGTIIISTPNKTVGRGKFYYQNWVAAHEGRSIFKPFKLHWKMIPEFANDPTWYDTQCKLLNNVEWKIAQELDMQFVASQNSFLPSETIKVLNNCSTPPLHSIPFFKHNFEIFKQSDPNEFYLIGVDTASEGGVDSSTVEVCDFKTLEQVAEYRGVHIRVEDFCDVVARIATMYPNNLLIVESNSYGNQVCEYLTRRDSFYNIYKTESKSNVVGQHSKKPKYKYGIYTGPQNRPLIIDALYTNLVENPEVINSELLALELIGLVDVNGKVQADDGEHDDLAIAYGFCCYVKLYDPPLGMALKFTNSESMRDLGDIASWNNGSNTVISPELSELKSFHTDDILERTERSNKILNKYVKGNLAGIMDANGGSTIDILKLMDLRNKKTNGEP